MKGIPSWVSYTVLRLVVFAIPLAVLLALGIEPWIAVVAAALIGLCVSYIFLRTPREAVARDLYEVRHPVKPVVREDDEVEDAAVDAAPATAPPVAAPRTPGVLERKDAARAPRSGLDA